MLKSREGVSLETNEWPTDPTGGSTSGGMSFHVASEAVSAFSERFAKGDELKTDDSDDEAVSTAGSSIFGVDGRDIVG